MPISKESYEKLVLIKNVFYFRTTRAHILILLRKVMQWVVGITTLKVAHSPPTLLFLSTTLKSHTQLQVLVKRKTTRFEGNTGKYAEMGRLPNGLWCREFDFVRQYSVASV
jgi:hypothetical protein